MVEINSLSVQGARRERYGWNPHISSIGRTPYFFWKREDTRDGPALVVDNPPTAPVWIDLFLIGDRPEQCRRSVVAGEDLAIRSDSCARIADRKSHVLDSRGSLAVMGSCE